MSSILPPGYRAVFLGASPTLEGLYGISALEEGAPEGRLMLMQLDFESALTNAQIAELNQRLAAEGVTPWSGYGQFVYADLSQPTVYICWVKGIAWLSAILGILLVMILPTLLGGFIWWLMPEEIKNLIMTVAVMGIMMLMMSMMGSVTRGEKKE